uniref:Dual specificity protein phosphatase n=1 Tax=Petromyzon marinus TaxID=7757 RepID=S4R851_PETMA
RMSDFMVNVLNELLVDEHGLYNLPCDHCDEVFPGILVGDAEIARSIRNLHRLGVTHVLNAAHGTTLMHVETGPAFYEGSGIVYHGIPACDLDSYDLGKFFEEGAEFIEKALSHPKAGRVLVHCREGYSRSPSLVVAFLMLRRGRDVQSALRQVRSCRAIGPNDGFLRQLLHLEYKLAEQREASA